MAASQGFLEFLTDALAPLGPVVARRMFSGAGLFADGLMFGLVFQDRVYLKVDDATRAAFEAEGMQPFEYTAKGRRVALGYWHAPERLLDEPDELVVWCRAAVGVARGAARKKTKPAPALRKTPPPSAKKRRPKAASKPARKARSARR